MKVLFSRFPIHVHTTWFHPGVKISPLHSMVRVMRRKKNTSEIRIIFSQSLRQSRVNDYLLHEALLSHPKLKNKGKNISIRFSINIYQQGSGTSMEIILAKNSTLKTKTDFR